MPDDVHAAPLDAHVLGRALEQLGGDLRGARRAPRARSARPQARSWRRRGCRRCPCRTGTAPCRRRTTWTSSQAAPSSAARDLGQRRRVALALRGHADVHVDLAARIDAHRGALVRARARCPARSSARPTPMRRAVAALRDSGGAATRRSRRSASARSKRRREIAGIVGDRHAVLVGEPGAVGHLGRAARSCGRRISAGSRPSRARADVHEALHDEHGLGPPGGAIGRVQRLGGHHARADVAVVRHAVGAGQVVDGVRGEARRPAADRRRRRPGTRRRRRR